MRFISSYFIFIGNDLITWRSKKQKIAALSSTKVEFKKMTKRFCELLWLKEVFMKISYTPNDRI